MNDIQPLKGRRNPKDKSRKKTEQIKGLKNTRKILENLRTGKKIEPLIKNESLCPEVKVGKIIGEGSFGVIATLTKPKFTLPVIIKKIKKQGADISFGSEIYTETVIGAILAEDYNKGESFNFPRLFSSFICEGSAHTISERLSGTVDEFEKIMGRKLVDADVHNILFQLLAGLYFAQTKYFFMHRDLHPGNFMLQKITSGLSFQGKKLNKVKNFTFNIDSSLYSIPNRGYILKIIDLGTASIVTPIEGKSRMVAQNVVFNRTWNGLFGGNWGNFGPDFEPSLDPIFAFISLFQDRPINAIMPNFLRNKVYKTILSDMFNKIKTGYMTPKEVAKAGRSNKFPPNWWTTVDGGLPRPFGALPNELFSPKDVIRNYFGFFKKENGSTKTRRFTTV